MNFLNTPDSLPKNDKPFLFYFLNSMVPEVLKYSVDKDAYISELTNGSATRHSNSGVHCWRKQSCMGWVPLPEVEPPQFKIFGKDVCAIFEIKGCYDVILICPSSENEQQLIYRLNSGIQCRQKALLFMHSLNNNVILNEKKSSNGHIAY